MPAQPIVTVANLGPGIAAVLCQVRDTPAAVINTAARTNPALRAEAATTLTAAGIDAGILRGVLDGIRA